jgi:Copper binding proteins, plastocyanin/azurin family
MTAPEYKPDTAVLSALLLIGLVLGASMFYVLVFPPKPKPISCPPATCIEIPSGVSTDSSLNFVSSNVTITAGSFVQWKNRDDSPHTVTSTASPSGVTKFDSGELDGGNVFFTQLTGPGVYQYHCIFHPLWMKGTIVVTP